MSILQMSTSGAVIIMAVVIIRSLGLIHLPKAAFPAMWGIALMRLLLPFSFPSRISVYSLVGGSAPPLSGAEWPDEGSILQSFSSEQEIFYEAAQAFSGATPVLSGAQPSMAAAGISPLAVAWCAGFFLCALFFALSYIRCKRGFRESLPVHSGFLSAWLAAHKTARRVQIRQSGRIASPLTYGVLRPVILMPKSTGWRDTERLEYILAHELTHIKRLDSAVKLLLAAALCIHWFNPLVWVMYILFNRDIELSCDEAVVRSFGDAAKSAYARTLICMEERKNRTTSLCSSFSKNAIEERITEIMNMKKRTAGSACLAAVLVFWVFMGLATSAVAAAPAATTPPAVGDIITTPDTQVTRKGLSVGDSAEAMKAALGEPTAVAYPMTEAGIFTYNIHTRLYRERPALRHSGEVENGGRKYSCARAKQRRAPARPR